MEQKLQSFKMQIKRMKKDKGKDGPFHADGLVSFTFLIGRYVVASNISVRCQGLVVMLVQLLGLIRRARSHITLYSIFAAEMNSL